MSQSSLIVISVDGLRASALGAYGNTWFGTPAIDRLAAQSNVYSRCFAADAELSANWDALHVIDLEQRLSKSTGRRSLLLTDDATIADLDSSQRFDEIVLTHTAPRSRPVESPTEIASAATLSALVEAVEESRSPVFAWAHLRFAGGAWDSPLELVESLLDDDDPRPEPSTEPPNHPIADRDNDDAHLLATLRYAAQVIALDACLGIVLDALQAAEQGRQATLALLGTRGFALGEHGVVGQDPRPYNECRQTPLIVRAGSDRQHRRQGALISLSAIGQVLVNRPADSADKLLLRSPQGAALLDEHWKLYVPDRGETELYSKPDDTWEINDVAVRHPDLVDELTGDLQAMLAEERPA